MQSKQFLGLAGALAVCVLCIRAHAADVPGAKEPTFLQRFNGSDIVYVSSKSYVQYKLGLDGFTKAQTIEGQLLRLIYRSPAGHTALEILRNYEQSLESKGFHRLYEHPVGNNDFYGGSVFDQSFQIDANAGAGGPLGNIQEQGAVIEKGVAGARDTTVVVYVGDYRDVYDFRFQELKDPVHFVPGAPIVIVDVITSAQIKPNMVTVKAADIADALATKGVVDLYGIHFDTDKTDVKPDSSETLGEVANLLKIDRSIRLEISGHTDSTGAKDHNIKLSQGRADAVVAVLVKKYGIDPKRLVSKGYGDTKPVAPNTTDDGKAKNRRVELRKI